MIVEKTRIIINCSVSQRRSTNYEENSAQPNNFFYTSLICEWVQKRFKKTRSDLCSA